MANTALNKEGEIFVSSATAAGASSITFTGLDATHYVYTVVYTHIDKSTDGYLQLRVSTDGGSSYISTSTYGSCYNYAYGASSSSFLDSNPATDSCRLETTSSGGASAQENSSGSLQLFAPNSSGYTQIVGQTLGMRTDGSTSVTTFGSYNATTSAVDAIEISPSAGTMSGNFYLYKTRLV